VRERFRSVRGPIFLSVWALLFGVVAVTAYALSRAEANHAFAGFQGLGSSVLVGSTVGRQMFHVMLMLLMAGVLLVVPAQAGVAIVGERERTTLRLLQVSQLSASQIVLGKLASSLGFVFLLLVVAAPLLVIPVLIGGVSVTQVLSGLGVIAATAVATGALAVAASARARTTQGAVLSSYLWVFGLGFGTMLLLLVEVFFFGPSRYESGFAGQVGFEVARDQGRELYAAHLNPFIALIDATGNPLRYESNLVDSPFEEFTVRQLNRVLLKRQGFAFGVTSDPNFGSSLFGNLGGGFGGFGGGPFPVGFRGDFIENGLGGFAATAAQAPQATTFEAIRPQVWPWTLGILLGLTVLSVWSAIRQVRVPRRGFLLRRQARGDDGIA